MKTMDWQIGRIPYSMALGVLVVAAGKLTSPSGVIVAYALFGGLTALSFRAIERPAWRAFIPLGIVVAATLIAPLIGAKATTFAHNTAFMAQLYMAIGAALRFGPNDKMSPRTALAREVLAKKRMVLKAVARSKAHSEAYNREVAVLRAILTEQQAYSDAHGHAPTPERDALRRRFTEQQVVVESMGVESKTLVAAMQAQSAELGEAREAWKNRNNRKAA